MSVRQMIRLPLVSALLLLACAPQTLYISPRLAAEEPVLTEQIRKGVAAYCRNGDACMRVAVGDGRPYARLESVPPDPSYWAQAYTAEGLIFYATHRGRAVQFRAPGQTCNLRDAQISAQRLAYHELGHFFGHPHATGGSPMQVMYPGGSCRSATVMPRR